MEFLSAKCPSCGAGIHVPGNKDYAFCTFCGSNVKVRESVIMKSDIDTDNLISLGNVELQAKDYNEAMEYFTRVLEVDGKNSKAWLGRGYSTIRKANSQLKLYQEAFVYFENAIENSPDTDKEALTELIIEEYRSKKFLTGHIEFLDKLINMKPERLFLEQVISLLDIVEADMSKSGNSLPPHRQTIKADALALLKENYPESYNKYLRNIEKKERGFEEQALSNDARKLEMKYKELFSLKKMLSDIFFTSLLNLIIALVIIIIYDSFGISEGFMRFVVIFFVLTVFAQLAVYVNKKSKFKAFKEELMLRKNPFRDMVQ